MAEEKKLKQIQKSEFVKEETIGSGRWLKLNKITYTDPHGQERTWEAAARTTTPESGVDAVVILPILRRTLKYDCILCIKQYRPPLKAYCLEFPAGLVDKGETLEAAAVRELKEETGYTAEIKHVSPATALDPGAETCTLAFVTAEIDGDDPVNENPQQKLEETEFIEVVTIPLSDLLTSLNEHAKEGVVVDSRVYSYAVAMTQATKPRKVEAVQK